MRITILTILLAGFILIGCPGGGSGKTDTGPEVNVEELKENPDAAIDKADELMKEIEKL